MRWAKLVGIAAAILAAIYCWAPAQAGSVVLAGSNNSAEITHVDPWSGREWFSGPFRTDFSGFTAIGVVALATHPDTRDMYAVFDTINGFHRLVRYDPRAFRATDLGDLGEFIVGLAFDSGGTLYGITSDDVQGTTDTIFTIDIVTGDLTYFMDTPGPDAFNDTIAFNPSDGKLYHSNGFPGSFQAIDLGTKAVTAIGYPPDWPANVGIRSFTWDSEQGAFVGYRQEEFGANKQYFLLTTTGVQTALGPGTFDASAIAFYDEPPPTPPASPTEGRFLFGVDANVNLISQLDPASGAGLGAIGVKLDGEVVSGFNGLATDPVTGEMYAVARLDSLTERLLVKVDPATGNATLVGDTGLSIAAIVFDESGTLYAMTGDNGIPGSTLFTLDKNNGSPTSFLTMSNNGAGEAIAFNSADGRIYRFSGNVEIEAIDLDTKTVTDIPLTGDTGPAGPPSAAVYDEVQGIFYAMHWTSDTPLYYSVTPGGVVTTIDPYTLPIKGYAFSLDPDPPGLLETPALFDSGIVAGEETWAAVTKDAMSGQYRAHVRQAANGVMVVDIDLGTSHVIGATAVHDAAGDSGLAVLLAGGAGAPKVMQYRLSDGALLRTTNVLLAGWDVLDLVTLDDMNGDDVSEYAALGRNSTTGEIAAQVRSGSNGAFIKNVFFLNSSWHPMELVVLPNFAGGAGPELGLLATNDPGQIVVMVKDAGTNGFLKNVFYLNANWSAEGAATIPSFSGNAAGEIGLGAVNTGSGQIVVMVKDAATNTFLNNVFPLSSNFDLSAGAIIPDETSNGASELAAMGVNKTSGKIIIQVRDTATGVFVRNLAPLGSNWTPVNFLAYDLDGGLRFAVVARRKSDGIQVVQTIDGSTGALVGNVFLD